MSQFTPFDPLKAKQIAESEVAAHALKREIENILTSYVGWYDPFCELIQNALDSVDEKLSSSEESYIPKVSITIDIENDLLTVSDNGIGLTKNKFEQFLAPCFSFKSGSMRGHKGVGATYLAYGFNYINISTKSGGYETTGKMTNSRSWLSDPSPSGNPELNYNPDHTFPDDFSNFESGVSITVGFDPSSYPKQLDWLKASNAKAWKTILLVKSGLGAFFTNSDVEVAITVISKNGNTTSVEFTGVEYYWPFQIQRKIISYSSLKLKLDELISRHGVSFVDKIPASLKNFEAIHDHFDTTTILSTFDLSEEEAKLVNNHEVEINFTYFYSAKVWQVFNDSLGIRGRTSILSPGIQIFANNMPQGEVIEIPLKRNIGRQRQIFLGIHFKNCKPDLGRKGFQNNIVQISKTIGQKIIESLTPKFKKQLRVPTGVAPDLMRESSVNEWKKSIEEHEGNYPLILTNQNFFLPTKSISITSEPTREQDVIALFNQMIAGGIIRGIRIMSTNEYFTYDGMYRVKYEEPSEHHLFDLVTNPLGIDNTYIDGFDGNFTSEPKILEYKFNLDGLIENIEDGSKNSNDISLVIVWKTGNDYQGNYVITSLLDPDNLSERQYHGVTHMMTSVTTGQKEMDLIVLSELVSFLNAPDAEISIQKQKYEEG